MLMHCGFGKKYQRTMLLTHVARHNDMQSLIMFMPRLQAVVRPLAGKNQQIPQVKRKTVVLLPHDFS